MANTVSFKQPRASKLLLDESPLVILPSLAAAIGLEAAVVLQQLHFLIRMKLERHREHSKESERDIHDGHIWVWNSYQKWQENHFSFLSVRSLQRIFLNLERKGLIVAGNYNEHNLDKTKWYSINYDHQLIKAIATTETTAPHKKNKNNDSLALNSDQRESVVDGAKLAPSIVPNWHYLIIQRILIQRIQQQPKTSCRCLNFLKKKTLKSPQMRPFQFPQLPLKRMKLSRKF